MFISHVESMKAFKSSVYSAAGLLLGGVFVVFLRESTLWPSDGDLLLITKLGFTERHALQSQLLPNRDLSRPSKMVLKGLFTPGHFMRFI